MSTKAITAAVENITPTKAKQMLATNTANRRIRPRTVASYARDMARGKWTVTGEAIKFDCDGTLRDGQHRLAAVVEANTAVRMMVVRNISPDAQRVMDSGIKRQVHDQLDIKGFGNTRMIASAARLALIEPGAGFVSEGKDQPTHAEIMEFIDAFEAELEQGAKAAAHYSSTVPVPPSVMVLSWMQFTQIDPAACSEFFEAMKQQRTDGEGDPRLALVRRLSKVTNKRERIPQRQALSLVFRAWNAWRGGHTLRTLPTHTRGEEVPIPSRLR